MKGDKFVRGWPIDDEEEVRLLLRNIQWIHEHEAQLKVLYRNKWYAVAEERVIASHQDKISCETMAIAVYAETKDVPPITMVHVGEYDRSPSFSELQAISARLKADIWAPADDAAESCERPVTAGEIIENLMDADLVSVSFDLHGTILSPVEGWNLRIYRAFRGVLTEEGLDQKLRKMEAEADLEEVADFVAGIAKKIYRKMDPIYDEDPDAGARWSIANSYALAELLVGGVHNTDLLIQLVGGGDEERWVTRMSSMAFEIHRRISGSTPSEWRDSREQREIVNIATDRGLAVSILSNGSQASVAACTRRFFPQIPPWLVFTPEVLGRAGKPSEINAALVLFSIGCGIIRNAIEGRRAPPEVVAALPKQSRKRLRKQWTLERGKYLEMLGAKCRAESPADWLSSVYGALKEFCGSLGLSAKIADGVFVLPHRHLHVGNSSYHDNLPFVGLGLPFRCLLYTGP